MHESSDLGFPVSHYVNRVPGSRGGGKLHPASFTRWICKGLSTPSGRVRLRATKVGVRWMIKEADFAEFIAILTAANLPPESEKDPPVSPAERRRESESASKKLDDLLGPRSR